MERSEWIGQLELLHVSIRSGTAVSDAQRAWYREARQQLLSTAVALQNTPVIGDERPRSAVRIEHAVPVRLGGEGPALEWMTTDVGVGGFSISTHPAVDLSRVTWAELDLSTGRAGARVRRVGTTARCGRVRTSFAFQEPSQELTDALMGHVLDELLPQIVFWDQVLEKVGG